MNILQKLRQRESLRKTYVIIDGADNSVTLSEKLYKRIEKVCTDEAKVFVFRLSHEPVYAFCVNPILEQPTQLADIQYNSKYRCIGFESLNPTVNRILYDYSLPAGSRVKLSVEPEKVQDMEIYKIMPNDRPGK